MNKEGQRRIIQGRGVKDGITTTYRGHTITVTQEELNDQFLVADGITIAYDELTITMTPEELHEIMRYTGTDLQDIWDACIQRFPGRAVKG